MLDSYFCIRFQRCVYVLDCICFHNMFKFMFIDVFLWIMLNMCLLCMRSILYVVCCICFCDFLTNELFKSCFCLCFICTNDFVHDLIIHVFEMVLCVLCMFYLFIQASSCMCLWSMCFCMLCCACFMCVFLKLLRHKLLCMLRIFFSHARFESWLLQSILRSPALSAKKCSYKWPRQGSNLQSPALWADALTTRPRGRWNGANENMQNLAKGGERHFCYRGARRTAICGARSGVAKGPRSLPSGFWIQRSRFKPSRGFYFLFVFALSSKLQKWNCEREVAIWAAQIQIGSFRNWPRDECITSSFTNT